MSPRMKCAFLGTWILSLSRSIPITLPLGPTIGESSCIHPPGAQPRSTTQSPVFTSRKRFCSSASLYTAREAFPSFFAFR